MKKSILPLLCVLLTSCERTSSETWEDVKTAGRYVKKSVHALFGFGTNESRQLVSNEDFNGPSEGDFIPLEDTDLQKVLYTEDYAVAQPEKLPTEKGETRSNYEQFVDASKTDENIFHLLHFATDSHVITEKKDLITLEKIAHFLKKKPKSHLVIEGHCDQRASSDYNIALGMRRAQHIRLLLTKKGINPNQLYTVSYGKEKPLVKGSSPEALRLNRRASFKLFIED
ncbi:MAG: OmpA family protein [Chlamydiota bacterium]